MLKAKTNLHLFLIFLNVFSFYFAKQRYASLKEGI